MIDIDNLELTDKGKWDMISCFLSYNLFWFIISNAELSIFSFLFSLYVGKRCIDKYYDMKKEIVNNE